MEIIKAHALGNDFLLLDEALVPPGVDRAGLAHDVCARHRGIGADGLIIHNFSNVKRNSKNPQDSGARGPGPGPTGLGPIAMTLLNADGSYSEVSGNGVRCLAAWIAEQSGSGPGTEIHIDTDAGRKRLQLLDRTSAGLVFRAAMGQPDGIARTRLAVGDDSVDAVTLRVGNPQCVVLGEATLDRLHGLASRLAVHSHFPQGTNVELATVEAPGRVRILIWERGVGPTEASGTGACAAAVAAITYGGADRDVEIASPGGTQRVEWREDGLYLTGPAQVVAVCDWQGLGAAADARPDVPRDARA